MCEIEQTPEKRYAAMLASGTASSVAKASPGIAVSGLTIYGYPIEEWVSILTAVYLICMVVGALPKVIEGLRYLYVLAKGEKENDKKN